MRSRSAIKLEGLSKRFGSLLALDAVDLEIESGSVFGFIGPNGAGKTTTIRLMLDFLRPNQGRVLVFGKDPRRDGADLRRKVGYLPGELRLDERLTARQALRYFSSLRGEGIEPSLELAERFDLDLDRKIKNLSTGSKQKVGLVQAFAHRPRVVVLDEPTSGLDPILQKRFQELLLERSEEGLTAFISSHILSELEEVAEEVAVIRSGKILQISKMSEMQKEALHRVSIHFKRKVPEGLFDDVAGASEQRYSGKVASLVVRGSMEEMMKKIGTRSVVSISSREPDLEEMFLAMYGGE